MTESADLPGLVRAAEAALGARFGPSVRLREARVIADRSRNVLVRCAVEPPVDGAGSVVVKWFRPGAELGFAEWASLAYLAGVEGAAGVAPRFLAGDVKRRLLVIEDVGDAGSLDAALNAGDTVVVRRGIRGLAAAYARLHASTVGTEAAFERAGASLPVERGPARAGEAARWLAGRANVEAWFAATGVAPRGLPVAMAAVAAVYRSPGPWLTFTHGDPAPTNNHVAGGTARLLDFEYGACRHALYNVTAWDVLCPLPDWLVAELRDAYRPGVVAAVPPAADDGEFALAWAAMVAYRALAILAWIPATVIEADAPWVGAWGRRGAVFVAASRLTRSARSHPGLAPFAPAAARFAETLAGRWPETAASPLPRWPALIDSTG